MFQLFAALLEANPSASLSEYYQSLVSPILAIEVWVSKGNVPALVRLLTSIIPRGATEIAKNNQLEPILGIFQQLVATRTNEIYAFELLECIVSIFPTWVLRGCISNKPSCLITLIRTTLENYYLPILQMLLTRLQNSKTETFTLRFVRFYHFMSAKDDTGLGADFFINVVDQIQSGYAYRLKLSWSNTLTTLLIKRLRPPLSYHYPARYTEAGSPIRSKDCRYILDQDIDRLFCFCREVQEGMGLHLRSSTQATREPTGPSGYR